MKQSISPRRLVPPLLPPFRRENDNTKKNVVPSGREWSSRSRVAPERKNIKCPKEILNKTYKNRIPFFFSFLFSFGKMGGVYLLPFPPLVML